MDKEGLRQFKGEVSKGHDISKLILFGSTARGRYNKESDVDLILVGNEFKDKSILKRPVDFYLEWNLDMPVDFICFTPEEFEEKSKHIGIVSEALKEGIEI
ncbi:MAG: hypothetical protein MSIBF_04655 [Candidatus Altiarchaeales archaeon IMC4]|nr:MAG: hypothetical protein MSIBF_04655 [Candidatus Altiarchaeales archaeon IMC4]